MAFLWRLGSKGVSTALVLLDIWNLSYSEREDKSQCWVHFIYPLAH